jgi:predicted deacylase
MDGVNMSGPLYWGAKSGGTTSHQLGALIGSVLTRADFYVDLHGNLEPCAPMTMMFLEQARDELTRKATLALGAAFGLTAVDMSAPPAHPKWLGEIESYPVPTALTHGIPALMVELVGARTVADADRGRRGLLAVLQSLDMLDRDGSDSADPTRLPGSYRYWGAQETDTAGVVWIRQPVGMPFEAGTVLLEVTDVCGEVLQEIRSPVDGFCWCYSGTLYGHSTHVVPVGAPVALIAQRVSDDNRA